MSGEKSHRGERASGVLHSYCILPSFSVVGVIGGGMRCLCHRVAVGSHSTVGFAFYFAGSCIFSAVGLIDLARVSRRTQCIYFELEVKYSALA